MSLVITNVDFPETLRFIFPSLRANHGHGGHESGVRSGVLGMTSLMTICPQGVAGPVPEKIPVFGVILPKLDHLTVLQPPRTRWKRCGPPGAPRT